MKGTITQLQYLHYQGTGQGTDKVHLLTIPANTPSSTEITREKGNKAHSSSCAKSQYKPLSWEPFVVVDIMQFL